MQQFSPARGVMGIYTITNRVTRLLYVGSAVDIGERWYTHRGRLRRRLHSNPRLQAAWDEHGEDAFNFLIIERVADLAALRDREQEWLDAMCVADPKFGYNLMDNARGVGFRFTDEQRARVSAALKGKPKSAAHIAAMRLRPVSPAQRANGRTLGLSGRGRVKTPEHLRKIGDPQRGSGNHRSKLTEDQVLEMKRLHAAGGMTLYVLGKRFGVAESTVCNIVKGKTWTHVVLPPD